MNRERTSGSVRCSKENKMIFKALTKGAAALLVAAALVAVQGPSLAAEKVKVRGLPGWLTPVAQRSLANVWSEMDSSQRDLNSRIELLELVSSRIFEGYSTGRPEVRGDAVFIDLVPGEVPDWTVEIVRPPLSPPVDRWFYEDTESLEKKLEDTVSPLPLESLSWTDISLREEIDRICSEHVKGWKPSILVNLSGSRATLQVRFNPQQPLVLAVRPEVSSSSIPVILRAELRDSLERELYVFSGLPVVWLEEHSRELESHARSFLLDRNTVENARADVDLSLSFGQISTLKADVESHRYSLSASLIIPVGADDRYPELKLHLGRIAQPLPGWDLEIYGEFLTEANDLDVESRWGMGWKPWKELWLGAEYSSREEQLWWKAVYRPETDGPYLWGRYSEEDLGIVGAGWPLNQYFSLELYYDERYEDSFCIRLVTEL